MHHIICAATMWTNKSHRLTMRQVSPATTLLHQWHCVWRHRQFWPAMRPVWTRRPLHEMLVAHLPFTSSRFTLQLVQRRLGRQVPPPLASWPQLLGHNVLLTVGAVVVGLFVGADGENVWWPASTDVMANATPSTAKGRDDAMIL